MDAVHKRSKEEEGPTSAPPRREEITDTMIFSPSDLVTMICRDVDLNFATRDTFTDTAISSSRINGDHKEKVLQRWEGGDSNGESYDLENDAVSCTVSLTHTETPTNVLFIYTHTVFFSVDHSYSIFLTH